MTKERNTDLKHQILLWEHGGRRWLVKLRFARVATSGRVECVGIDLRSFIGGEEQKLTTQPGAGNVGFLRELKKVPAIESTDGVVTAALLRAFPAGSVIQEGAKKLAHNYYLQERMQDIHEALGGIGPAPDKAKSMRQRQRAAKSPRTGLGRPPYYDQEHFRKVASIYTAAFESGLHPTEEVASYFNLSTSAAGKHVRRARKLGFLPLTTRGVAKADIPPTRKRKATRKGSVKK